MSNGLHKSTLSTIKNILAAGYAISLLVPYKVEKHDGETTYHAPLYKLAYKSVELPEDTEDTVLDGDECEQTQADIKFKTVHTYTITSFGLLNDQIDTAKRLYMAALIKKPIVTEKAKKTLSAARSKADTTIKLASDKAKTTIKGATEKAQTTIKGVSDKAKITIKGASSKMQSAVNGAKAGAVKTAGAVKAKAVSAKDTVFGIDDKFTEFIESLID